MLGGAVAEKKREILGRGIWCSGGGFSSTKALEGVGS